MRFVAPGRASVAWRLKDWSFERNLTNDWNSIASDLERDHDLLNLVQAALQKPAYDSGFD